jgi:hypothetical protein
VRFRAHVKVYISAAHHPKTRDVWSDRDMRSILVELWRLGQERYAAKRGDRVTLTPGDRLNVAGEEDVELADALIARTCEGVGYRVDRYSNRWVVTVRNLAKRQGIGAPVTDTQERREKREEVRVKSSSAPRTPAGARPARSKRTPDDFPDEVRAITRRFLDYLQRVWPGLQEPTAATQLSWLTDMDRLVRLGPPGANEKPVSIVQIDKLCAVLFDPDADSEVVEFWRTNIRSPRKLRKHWEDVLIKLQHEMKTKQRRTTDGKREQARGKRDDRNRAAAERVGRQQRRRSAGQGTGGTGTPEGGATP